jgi:hypothetical protein
MPALSPDRLAPLYDALGHERVDAMLEAAEAAGGSYLPGDQEPVFGFIMRALISLKNGGRNYGLVFPKQDGGFKRFIDYFDGEGGIYIIYPGTGPGEMRMDPEWIRPAAESHPDCPFFEVAPGAGPLMMASFLEAYAALRTRDDVGA